MENMLEIYHQMKIEGVAPNAVVYNEMLKTVGKMKDIKMAIQLLEEMDLWNIGNGRRMILEDMKTRLLQIDDFHLNVLERMVDKVPFPTKTSMLTTVRELPRA
eukprot:TRINITY_DN5172_c0_g1_i1.p1 TRINITY_DN5172_c0_g1~~TRINITY_DN5172_c0_g1_i1.p1  ORF type:complete len:103 (-),score=26.63 TRINITY_DN5172_c0_g1_i1:170-478(-)